MSVNKKTSDAFRQPGRNIHAGLSLMLEPDFYTASLPLFNSDIVDVIEWSPDIGWGEASVPAWASALLKNYSEKNRLYGHGVRFSPMSCVWTPADDQWLTNLDNELRDRRFVHFSEHFGFMRSPNYSDAAPLPMPFTAESLKAGRNKLQMLAEFAGAIPIGLENLALAFSRFDVDQQGAFLDQLLDPIDGFIILDLHNLYCQMMNFNLEADVLLEYYPLQRVREIHISGGSWSESSDFKKLRRDTHDDSVPEEVFDLLRLALSRCPNVEAVILERLGGTIKTAEAQIRFARDFHELRKILSECPTRSDSSITKFAATSASPFLLDTARKYQDRLMRLLDTPMSSTEIVSALRIEFGDEDLADYVESLRPEMIEVGQELMTKWAVPI